MENKNQTKARSWAGMPFPKSSSKCFYLWLTYKSLQMKTHNGNAGTTLSLLTQNVQIHSCGAARSGVSPPAGAPVRNKTLSSLSLFSLQAVFSSSVSSLQLPYLSPAIFIPRVSKALYEASHLSAIAELVEEVTSSLVPEAAGSTTL